MAYQFQRHTNRHSSPVAVQVVAGLTEFLAVAHSTTARRGVTCLIPLVLAETVASAIGRTEACKKKKAYEGSEGRGGGEGRGGEGRGGEGRGGEGRGGEEGRVGGAYTGE